MCTNLAGEFWELGVDNMGLLHYNMDISHVKEIFEMANKELRNRVDKFNQISDGKMKALHEANKKAIEKREPEFDAKYESARVEFIKWYNELTRAKSVVGIPNLTLSAMKDGKVNIGGFEFKTNGQELLS